MPRLSGSDNRRLPDVKAGDAEKVQSRVIDLDIAGVRGVQLPVGDTRPCRETQALRATIGTVALRGRGLSGDLPMVVGFSSDVYPANTPRTLLSMLAHRRTANSLTCRKTPLQFIDVRFGIRQSWVPTKERDGA